MVSFEGSIAEREHLKWKNAIDLPNNPYSAEALQRRITQTSQSRQLDLERLASKVNGVSMSAAPEPLTEPEKPLKVVLGQHQPDPVRYVQCTGIIRPRSSSAQLKRKSNFIRYGRDYYINDARNASGSRRTRTTGDLRRIRTDIDERSSSDVADLYIDDDDDDDSVSDLELFSNRSRRDRVARVSKSSTLYARRTNVSRPHPFEAHGYRSSGGRMEDTSQRSMSVCSLSSAGSSSSQAWSWADDDDFKNVAQIERAALLNDIRRCSFRSRNGTNNFVMNPLFCEEADGGGTNESHT